MSFYHKISTFFFLVGVDQYIKLWALSGLSDTTIEVFPFFRLVLAFNKGIAFSVVIPFTILILLSIIFLGLIGWWLFFQKHSLLEEIGFLGIISGGVGNLVDRITRGEVIDFLSFWNFPIFNGADILITIGIVFVIWGQWVESRKK